MKKGVSLIELLVVMSIVLILFTSELNVFMFFIKKHNSNSTNIRGDFYTKEALMYIEDDINKAQGVTVNNNKIEITRIVFENNSNVKYIDDIFLNNSNIVIRYYRNGLYKGQNNVMTKVGGFSAEMINRLLYVNITDENGQEEEKCFLLKNSQ